MNGLNLERTTQDNADISACAEFLERYCGEDIMQAATGDTESVNVDWRDLYQYDADIAQAVTREPEHWIAQFRAALEGVNVGPVSESDLEELDVRLTNVTSPETTVSGLRTDHLGRLVGLRGQVSLASQVIPEYQWVVWRCERCHPQDVRVGPVRVRGDEAVAPDVCPSCETNGPFTPVPKRSQKEDHQIIELTDPPGESPGNSSDSVLVDVYGDLAGQVSPGDRVRINGIANPEHIEVDGGKGASARPEWQIHGHGLDEEQVAFAEVEPERVDEIQELSNHDNVQEQFVRSFAPHILTDERGDNHKLAILLSLFGGASEHDKDDINLLFIGAPGTGKSEYLQEAKELAPKAVEASGKGATAAGLTASATQHEATGKWMLDAGALVLASGGVACIDEFDKMAGDARKSMHEAMENQQVPINKAGINTTLTTETTVIAAANPKGGSFDRFTALNEQIELGSALLSRFDLIFGLFDDVDPERDREISTHQHSRAADDGEVIPPLDSELIREYIAYARQHCAPTYGDNGAKQMLVDYYVNLRQESGDDDDSTPVTARVNDALRRLAQASARMHLRDTITEADAETAISLMKQTIGDTALTEDGEVSGSHMEGRTETVTQEDRRREILHAISDEPLTPAEVAKQTGLEETTVRDELEALKTQGDVVEPEVGEFRAIRDI